MTKARYVNSFRVSEVHTINVSFLSHMIPEKIEIEKDMADMSSKYHLS